MYLKKYLRRILPFILIITLLFPSAVLAAETGMDTEEILLNEQEEAAPEEESGAGVEAEAPEEAETESAAEDEADAPEEDTAEEAASAEADEEPALEEETAEADEESAAEDAEEETLIEEQAVDMSVPVTELSFAGEGLGEGAFDYYADDDEETLFDELSTAATIKNGAYTILSAINNNFAVDVKGGSTQAANVWLYKKNGTEAQQFYFLRLSNGNYKITNINSGLALDVYAGKAQNKVNVWQYKWNGSKAQQWKLVSTGDGNYELESALNSNMVLDIYAGKAVNKNNIQIYKRNGTKAQRFKLSVVYTGPQQPMNGGLYTIKTADGKYVLDVYGGSLANDANVQIYTSNNTNAQKWYMRKSGSNYTITSACSGLRLDIDGSVTANGTNVIQFMHDETTGQSWKFVDTGSNSFYIVNAGGKYLTVSGTAKNGANVNIQTGNSSAAQKFVLAETSVGNGWLTDPQTLIRKKYSNGSVTATDTQRYGTLTRKKTLTAYLKNAMVPVGQTLYIWGGGWSDGESGAIIDNRVAGAMKSWKTFFNTHNASNYDYLNYQYSYANGLDCSGFAGWVIYNTLNSKDAQTGYTVTSTNVASSYINRGWADASSSSANPSKFYAGDVVSLNGHVWISLGECSDGSVVLVHSSPNGVQLSGSVVPSTGASNSQAYTLADKYMKKYFPQWPYATRCVGLTYLTNLAGVAHWKTSGGLLTDPDGLQSKSANDVLKLILGNI